MQSQFGKNIKVVIWGGSHEPSIGVDIEGLPKGTIIDMKKLRSFLKRRAPGNSPFSTKRKEPDIPIPVSGLDPVSAPVLSASGGSAAPDSGSISPDGGEYMAVTSPQAVVFEIKNTDTRSRDYTALRSVPRPGHADYTARIRYGDSLNMSGGGPFSARMTAPMCIAGGIALQLLEKKGIFIGAHIYSIKDTEDTPFDPLNIPAELLSGIKEKDFPVISDEAGKRMIELIAEARADADSLGGIIEGCAVGLPAGIGGAMYDGLESFLAPILFGIPAVKGVEFGAGFTAARLKGSENNDAFFYDDGKVKTITNNHGGILGGITTGMPLITRLAFKPTPSIGREQDSVDLDKKEKTKLTVRGRHDPCVAVRAVPVVEAALALGILDCSMEVKQK